MPSEIEERASEAGQILSMTETEREQQALLVNDIHVLSAQLNERMREAVAKGLKVEATTSAILEVQARVIYYPTVSVSVWVSAEA